MRVAFLDIDGVLNNDEFYRTELRWPKGQRFHDVDRNNVECLNKITKATGAKVVLSSTWRLTPFFRELIQHLHNQGVDAEIIGRTPWFDAKFRGEEILAWLQCQVELPAGFCILDDENGMTSLSPWLVQTNPALGLVDSNVEPAIKLLHRSFSYGRKEECHGHHLWGDS